MTRPYARLSRRDRELDAQAMAARAAEVGPVLDQANATESGPAQPPRLLPLGLLKAGTRFRWAGVLFVAEDRFSTGNDGVEHRGVVYRQATGFAADGDAGLMPMNEDVEVVP